MAYTHLLCLPPGTMLSFISIGGRKKRARARKRSSGSASPRVRTRAERTSVSFASPGDVGVVVAKRTSLTRSTDGSGASATMERTVVGKGSLTSGNEDISPAIQLDFKHDSLLNSLPEQFLKEGRTSSESSASSYSPVRREVKQAVRIPSSI